MLRPRHPRAVHRHGPEPDPPHHRRTRGKIPRQRHRRLGENVVATVRHLRRPGHELGRTPPPGYAFQAGAVVVIGCGVGVDAAPVRERSEGIFFLVAGLRELRLPPVDAVVVGVYEVPKRTITSHTA